MKMPLILNLDLLYRCLVGEYEFVLFGGVVGMLISRAQLSDFLDDDFMTDGLADEVAKAFIAWLVESAERLVICEQNPVLLKLKLQRLALKGRSIRKILVLWDNSDSKINAYQLINLEGLQEAIDGPNMGSLLLLEKMIEIMVEKDKQVKHSVEGFRPFGWKSKKCA